MQARERVLSPSMVRRARSSASICEPLDFAEHLNMMNPENARRDALAAASHAFQRANQRSSGNSPRVLENERYCPASSAALDGMASLDSAMAKRPASRESYRPSEYFKLEPTPSVLSLVLEPGYANAGEARRVGLGYANGIASTSSFKRLRRSRSLASANAFIPKIWTSSSPNGNRRTGRHLDAALRGGSRVNRPERKPSSLFRRGSFLRGGNDPPPLSSPEYRTYRAYAENMRSENKTDLESAPQFALDQSHHGFRPHSSIGCRVRHISSTWRQRIKKTLGSNSSPPRIIPIQHIQSIRRHFSEDNPYYGATGPLGSQDSSSTGGKLRGFRDTSIALSGASGSRITSWGNTISSGETGDSARLSVIKEGSSRNLEDIFLDKPKIKSRSSFIAFKRPMRARTSAVDLTGKVDTRSVYSALLKKLERKSSQASVKSALKEAGSLSGDTVKLLSGSVAHLIPVQDTPDTPTRLSVKGSTISMIKDDTLLPGMATAVIRCDLGGAHTSQSRPLPPLPPRRLSEISMSSKDQFRRRLTPQQVANLNENVRPRAGLRESQSLFFPYSVEGKPKTPSPYRLAKAQSIESEAGTNPTLTALENGSLRPAASLGVGYKNESMSSVSVYSPSSGSQPSPNAGSVIHYRLQDVGAAPGQISLASTLTTNKQLVRQVRSSDDFLPLNLMTLENSHGHQREQTQITGDDRIIRQPSQAKVLQPLGVVSNQISPTLSRRKSVPSWSANQDDAILFGQHPKIDTSHVPADEPVSPRNSTIVAPQVKISSRDASDKGLHTSTSLRRQILRARSMLSVSDKVTTHVLSISRKPSIRKTSPAEFSSYLPSVMRPIALDENKENTAFTNWTSMEREISQKRSSPIRSKHNYLLDSGNTVHYSFTQSTSSLAESDDSRVFL
jgi:hypothetical protein